MKTASETKLVSEAVFYLSKSKLFFTALIARHIGCVGVQISEYCVDNHIHEPSIAPTVRTSFV